VSWVSKWVIMSSMKEFGLWKTLLQWRELTFKNPCSNGENWEKVIVEKIISPNGDRENEFLHYVLFRFWFTQQFVNLFPCYAEVIYFNIHSYSIHLKTKLFTPNKYIPYYIKWLRLSKESTTKKKNIDKYSSSSIHYPPSQSIVHSTQYGFPCCIWC